MSKLNIFLFCRSFSYALSICLISKHNSFEHEEEVRLLLYDGDKSRLNTHPNGFYYPLDRFIACNSERKYHELDDELNLVDRFTSNSKYSLPSAKLKKEFLKEVWVGSKLDNNQISKIRNLLMNAGYPLDDIKIEKIVLPYR